MRSRSAWQRAGLVALGALVIFLLAALALPNLSIASGLLGGLCGGVVAGLTFLLVERSPKR